MQSADVGHEEEEGDSPAGYYMDSNGMLVMAAPEQGEGGFGGLSQEDLGEGVNQMRRDLSGEAYEWLPSQQKSQGSDEARHDAAGYDSVPETYEAYEAQQYASGAFGGAFSSSGAWGSAGALGAEDEAEAAEWSQTDAIALEPAHPFDEWNFGGTVAVHTR